jgi:hypothetical protein
MASHTQLREIDPVNRYPSQMIRRVYNLYVLNAAVLLISDWLAAHTARNRGSLWTI